MGKGEARAHYWLKFFGEAYISQQWANESVVYYFSITTKVENHPILPKFKENY